MTYGASTRSYNRSTEKRQMDADRKDATDRHLGLCSCGKSAIALCAWRVKAWYHFGQQSRTCDAPVCFVHGKRVGEEKYLCPEHQKRYDDWKKKQVQQGNLFAEVA